MIGKRFFARDPVTCARELVGCELWWGACRGVVVETEAYDAEGDAACHTVFRPGARAFVEAHPAGTAYVYLNYGVHWMLNVLVKGPRLGFVLIRALEPRAGLAVMRRARGRDEAVALCSGPGKLTQALGVDGRHHGVDLCADRRRAFYRTSENRLVAESPRIGINRAVDLPWRFFCPDSPHVSGAKKRPDGDEPARP